MSRYRPPQPQSSPYITKEGFDVLQKEQTELWERRTHVTQALAAAAAEGDRSENAEYIYRKKELREIDRRIRYLQKRIPRLTVVSGGPPDKSRVFFGAWVGLEDENGNQVDYRIVGPDEFNRNKNHISIDAPLAKALLKKAVDDEVMVNTPGGEKRFVIVDIRYPVD